MSYSKFHWMELFLSALQEQDYAAAAHAAAFGVNMLPTTISSAFPLPHNSVAAAAAAATFGHAAVQAPSVQSASNGGSYNGAGAGTGAGTGAGGAAGTGASGTGTGASANSGTGGGGTGGGGGGAGTGAGNTNSTNSANNGHAFSFASPTAPSAKEGWYWGCGRDCGGCFWEMGWVFLLDNYRTQHANLQLIPHRTHRHPARHPTRRNRIMAGALKSSTNKSDRLVVPTTTTTTTSNTSDSRSLISLQTSRRERRADSGKTQPS